MCQLCNSPCPIPVPKGFSPTLLVKRTRNNYTKRIYFRFHTKAKHKKN